MNQANMVGEYDMCSVMHYGAWDFGKKVESDQRGKMQTVLPKHNRFEKYCSIKEVGKRQNFTNEDIVKLNILYDCDKGGIFCTHIHSCIMYCIYNDSNYCICLGFQLKCPEKGADLFNKASSDGTKEYSLQEIGEWRKA